MLVEKKKSNQLVLKIMGIFQATYQQNVQLTSTKVKICKYIFLLFNYHSFSKYFAILDSLVFCNSGMPHTN